MDKRVFAVLALTFLPAIVAAQWTQKVLKHPLYEQTRTYSNTFSENLPNLLLGLMCISVLDDDNETVSDLVLMLRMPDDNTLPIDKPVKLDLRVDKQTLHSVNLTHANGNIYTYNLLSAFEDSVTFKYTSHYADEQAKTILNELLDGITVVMRIPDKRLDYLPVFDLRGMTGASLSTLKACAIESRSEARSTGTFSEYMSNIQAGG